MASFVGDVQASRGATTHKIYLILLTDQRLSTESKIVSKYCNISKTLGKGSIHPPPFYHVGVWICVYVRVEGAYIKKAE